MRKSLVLAAIVTSVLIAGLGAVMPAFAQPAQAPTSGGSLGTRPGQTDERAPIITEVPVPIAGTVPGSTAERAADYLATGRVEDLAQYIGIIYNFLISIVGVVAAVAMIIGGFQYLTSAGDAGKIGAAKGKMANAFIGLILALGAYTILNTINPALLSLTVPDFRKVKTEIFMLPWCDDLTLPVTPVGDGTSCGFVGKYMQGNSEHVCIYSGSCRAQRVSEDTTDVGETPDDDEKNGLYKTCVQVANVETKTVMDAIALNKNKKFAECLYCADMTNARAKDMGFSVENACLAWMIAFDSVPQSIKDAAATQHHGKVVKDGFFHVCYPRTSLVKKTGNRDLAGSAGCMGAPIFCYDVTRNEDCTACGDSVNNGCEGYDEAPSPSFAGSLDANGYAKPRYTYDEDGMEEYPVHLGTLCASNPCREYVDPESGGKPFFKGCKSGNGITYAAQRIVRHGDIGAIDDCRNQ